MKMEICDSCKKDLLPGMKATNINGTHLFCADCFYSTKEKEFLAKKRYYIHGFSSIQKWFGDRGITIEKNDILDWCYDGENLFFIPSLGATKEIKYENPKSVLVCKWDCLHYEVAYEMDYNDSPFANKIKNKW